MTNKITLDAFLKKKGVVQSPSGQTSEILPELPEGWKLAKLRNLGKYINGRAFKQEEWETSGLPIIRIQNLTNPSAPYNYCSKPVKPKYYVKNGDLLISWSATLDAFIWSDGDAILNQHIFKVEVNEKLIDKKFLFYAIKHILEEMKRKIHGSTMKHITKSKFESTEIPLPPLDEQKHIVARIEEIMSRTKQANKLREEALKDTAVIMQSALHQIFSRAEEKGWDSKQLEEVAQINRESRNPSAVAPDEEFTYIDISSIESGSGQIVQVKRILGRDAPSRARRVIHYDDVLMSTVRPYLKSFAIVPKEYDNQICSTGFAVLTSKESLLPRYLLYCLFSDTIISQCNSMMIGAHYPALNQKQVAKIKMAVPSIEEQERIIRYLDSINEKNQVLRKHQEETKEEIEAITQAVLRKAFTGQL